MYTIAVLTNYAFKYYDYHSRYISYWTFSLTCMTVYFLLSCPVIQSNPPPTKKP